MIRIAAGLFALLAMAGAASADELRPMQARTIALGDVTGVAYYTVSEDGYELVATFAAGEGATPVRFVATLAAGQRIVLSIPQAADQAPVELEFARLGDTLIVSDPAIVTVMN